MCNPHRLDDRFHRVMCQCLSFPVLNQGWFAWRRSFALLFDSVLTWAQMFTSTEVELFRVVRTTNPDAVRRALLRRMLREGYIEGSVLPNGKIYVLRQTGVQDLIPNRSSNPARSRKRDGKKRGESMMNVRHSRETSYRSSKNGGSDFASLFTRQGLKGVNQDAMLVWEDFGAQADTIFCGVFDGHGPHGHLVARNVRDMLPLKLASCLQALQELHSASEKGKFHGVNDMALESEGRCAGGPQLISEWQESFLNAYTLVDRELLIDYNVDCISSGTTAVTLVKQGKDLIIGNVGDSRAVLCVRDDDNSLLAVQLTVDLTPNLPKEAERIRRCKGRVFALRQEPSVERVWLPHQNSPGLAMARALGDFSLKSHGVISVPEVTYRRLTEKDKFIVLATDGVWDVLSNEQVVEIVASIPSRSLAAKAVVDTAATLWRSKYPAAKVDDCAAVCLFLDNAPAAVLDTSSMSKNDSLGCIEPNSLAIPLQVAVDHSGDHCDVKDGITTHLKTNGGYNEGKTACTAAQNIFTPISCEPGNIEETEVASLDAEEQKWSALGGVTWANTLVSLPKFVPGSKKGYRYR